jgi:hypothetical protein
MRRLSSFGSVTEEPWINANDGSLNVPAERTGAMPTDHRGGILDEVRIGAREP